MSIMNSSVLKSRQFQSLMGQKSILQALSRIKTNIQSISSLKNYKKDQSDKSYNIYNSVIQRYMQTSFSRDGDTSHRHMVSRYI